VHGIEIHRFGLAGREVLLFMLGASFVTLVFTRLYTRLARVHGWKSGRVGDVHLHHMVFGIALVLVIGMLDLAIQPGEFWRELFAVGFGVGAAFMLDEFALSLHLRDVYWTPEGRHSIDASIMWMLLGCLLLVGLAPFGIRDQTEIPRAIAFGLVAFSIILSVVTCLKGKLTLGLLSVFLPPVGLVSAVRLARPGSVWAQLFYRGDGEKIARSLARFHPHDSFGERLRVRVVDFVGGAPNPAPHDEHR
jgi:hypothetical protein